MIKLSLLRLLGNLFNEFLEYNDIEELQELDNIINIINQSKKNDIENVLINSLIDNIFNKICDYSQKMLKESNIIQLTRYLINNNILSNKIINLYYENNIDDIKIDYPNFSNKFNIFIKEL